MDTGPGQGRTRFSEWKSAAKGIATTVRQPVRSSILNLQQRKTLVKEVFQGIAAFLCV